MASLARGYENITPLRPKWSAQRGGRWCSPRPASREGRCSRHPEKYLQGGGCAGSGGRENIVGFLFRDRNEGVHNLGIELTPAAGK
jgi:hypothetical protein